MLGAAVSLECEIVGVRHPSNGDREHDRSVAPRKPRIVASPRWSTVSRHTLSSRQFRAKSWPMPWRHVFITAGESRNIELVVRVVWGHVGVGVLVGVRLG